MRGQPKKMSLVETMINVLIQKYFYLACKRVEESYNQGDLFMPAIEKVKQEKFI